MGYYDSIAKGYDELHKGEQFKKLTIIKKHIKIKKSARLLDLGCGTGISSKFNCFVVGIDPSFNLLRQNKIKRKIMGTAEFLPFKNGSFDCIVSVTAIHNFSDLQKAIGEMKRVCNKDIIISVLKKSGKFDTIKTLIAKNLKIKKVVEEDKDTIFFCQNHKVYI